METNKNQDFLATAPVGKLLMQLSIPTIAAQLINMLYNIVDRIYIGHMPENGDLALTGVGVCMPIILFVSAFAALISASGAPRASIFLGKKEGWDSHCAGADQRHLDRLKRIGISKKDSQQRQHN